MGNKQRTRTRGNSVLEFTLVGIPLIFILIGTFEMSRGMWSYHTLAHAVKSGVRYSVVHGKNCAIAPNACTVSISQIADKIRSAGVGLSSDLVTLTFTPAKGAPTTCVMRDCIANYQSPAWPPASANAPGQDVRISGAFEFRSGIALFWPGAGAPVAGAPALVRLSADSQESIQY
jgi:hypothetical protein